MTSVGAGTIAYIDGGFSTDLTINANWTDARSSFAALGIVTHVNTNTSGISYAPNVQYKFELGNSWYIGIHCRLNLHSDLDGNFDAQTGHSTKVHCGQSDRGAGTRVLHFNRAPLLWIFRAISE